MVTGFLIIVGVYGLCAALIHAYHAFGNWDGREVVYQLVLVTRNNQTQIEWYVNAYLFVSWLRGRQTVITAFDDGSTDETLEILQHIARERTNVRVYPSTDGLERFLEEHDHQPLLVLRLYQMDLNPKRPLEQW